MAFTVGGVIRRKSIRPGRSNLTAKFIFTARQVQGKVGKGEKVGKSGK